MQSAPTMQARDVMATGVLTCSPGDAIATVARSLDRRRVGASVVVDADGVLVGVVTARDLCRAVGEDALTSPMSSVMTAGVIWVRPEQTVEQVAHLMAKHGVHRVPVLDARCVPIGMISISDLAIAACKRGKRRDRVTVARTLAAIRGADPARPPHGVRDRG